MQLCSFAALQLTIMPDLFIANDKMPRDPRHSPYPKSTSHHAHPNHTKKIPILASFTENPNNLQFENQETNEVIHLFLRHHFITNVRWIITFLLGLLIPLCIFIFLPFLEEANLTIPNNYLFILACFYYLILTGYAFINFVTWYYNVGIVTNIRVVDIDIAHITSKNVAATGLADIVDVEYSQSGFMQNLFDYGNVHMQTEGLKANFEFLNVPKPAKTTDVISDLMREVKNE
jgi:hypothetical protein